MNSEPVGVADAMKEVISHWRTGITSGDEAMHELVSLLANILAATPAPAVEREPVLWVHAESLANKRLVGVNAVRAEHQDIKDYTVPLYTTPPAEAREPVGDRAALVRDLRAIRQRALDAGMKPLTLDEIHAEIAEAREPVGHAMTDTNPRMTDAEAIQVLRDIADEFEFRSYYKEVVTALAHIEALRARVEAARYFASGPVGSFWTNEHQVAHELICGHPLLCRDDWTITDLHEAARTNTQGREA